MVKLCRFLVTGPKNCGQTSLILQLISGKCADESTGHSDDIYSCHIQSSGSRAPVRILDANLNVDGRAENPSSIAFIPDSLTPADEAAWKFNVSVSDCVMIVVDPDDASPTKRIETVRKLIERFRERRDVIVIILVTKSDLGKPHSEVNTLAQRANLKVFDVCGVGRRKSVIEAFSWAVARLQEPVSRWRTSRH